MNRGAIILCGGASARMGRDKAALPFGPQETLLTRTVRLVGEAVPAERMVVVAAADHDLPALPRGVRILHDAAPGSGPLAALAIGLAALEADVEAAFACGCDTPLLVPALVARMFDHLGDHHVVAPDDGQRVHPLAAVYRTGLAPTAESLLSAGKRSLHALLEQCDIYRLPADQLRDVDRELLSLTNCNTPADYQWALAQAFPQRAER